MPFDWSPPARQTLARPPAAPPLTVADTAVAADTHNRTAPVAVACNHTVTLAAESNRKVAVAAANTPVADVVVAKAAPGKDTDSYCLVPFACSFCSLFLLFYYQIKPQSPSHYYHALQAYHPISANTMSKRTAPV